MAPTSLPMYTADAFTEKAFSGNPAGVCFVEDPQSIADKQRQLIAAEMNITTAFVELLNVGDSFKTGNRFRLRWFTPMAEIALCGHATLASTAVLIEVIGNKNTEFKFDTKTGELKTRKEDGLVVLNLPQSSTTDVDMKTVEGLLQLLCPLDLVEEVRFSPELNDLLVRLKPKLSRVEFEALSPQIKDMVQSGNYRTVCITTQAINCQDEKGRTYDYFNRVFAPWIGISEDSVTGSSYTMTAPYWQKILGKSKMYARQCSPRGGDVSVQVLDDGRLEVAGAAAINIRGSFLLQSN